MHIMSLTSKKIAGLVLSATALLGGHSLAMAKDWPSEHPITMVVGYPPGGGYDVVGRLVAQFLGKELNQSVVVENKSGASGVIGAGAVARAKPDGYTMFLASPAEIIVNRAAGQKLPYDPDKDLTPVALVGDIPTIVVASPSVNAKTIQELVALGKATDLSYGSPGAGGPSHFAGESINAAGGINVLHVPFRGSAPAVSAVVGGQVNLGIFGISSALPLINSGKLHPIAIASKTRSELAPGIPALGEVSGYEDVLFTNWIAVYLPGNVDAAITQRLAAALRKITSDPAYREKLTSMAVEAKFLQGDALQAFLKEEDARYTEIAKKRHIKMQ